MKYLNCYSIVLMLVFSTSCEKVINVDLNNVAPKLVIEGIIDDSGDTAKVKISKSVSFSANSNYPNVMGAIVKVSDNMGGNYNFTQISNGDYINTALIGVSGRIYTLNVQVEGKMYTASCTMPLAVPIDTIFQETINIPTATKITSIAFTDPVGFGNNYHFIQKVNGKLNKNIFVADDLYNDGGTVVYQLFDNDNKFKTGDSVEVEMRCVAKPIYRYFVGLFDLQNNNTVPANPESNINNGALGYFSAHSSHKVGIRIR